MKLYLIPNSILVYVDHNDDNDYRQQYDDYDDQFSKYGHNLTHEYNNGLSIGMYIHVQMVILSCPFKLCIYMRAYVLSTRR